VVGIVKELAEVLKDLPDLAIWIMIGILFYKVVIVGSIFGIIKLAITKAHDAITKPKTVVTEYKLDDVVYQYDGSLMKLKDFLRGVVSLNNGYRLSTDEVNFIIEAYEEKIQRENVTKSHQLKPGEKKKQTRLSNFTTQLNQSQQSRLASQDPDHKKESEK
jgi:uncharacterized protein YqhQ